jgi:hypothetical protein
MSRVVKLLAGALGLLGLHSPAMAELQESPQHFAVELKFGPYVPHLDDATWLNGRTPFSDHFGDPGDPKGARPHIGLLSQVEFDYQFWNKFGSLGIGLEGGYYGVSAPAFTALPVTDSHGVTTQQSCQVTAGDNNSRRYSVLGGGTNLDYYKDCTSGDSDKLNIVPLALLLIYRFDVLDKRFRIPIIPYLKVGLAYYFWWFGSSSSFTAQYTVPGGTDKANAAGGSLGVVFHPGLALDLSALDPRAARAIDQEIGLNRVAAFVELNAVLVDGFRADHVMNLSDTTVSAGLSFEF